METLIEMSQNPNVLMGVIVALFMANVILTCFVFAAMLTNGTKSRNRAAQLAHAIDNVVYIIENRIQCTMTDSHALDQCEDIRAQLDEITK